MRCIVTAGPTFEPLDQVRRLTNFSTGRLGSDLADHLAAAGHEVMLLRGVQATWTRDHAVCRVETFTTTADLTEKLRALGGATIGAVFHAAAVSDFTFGTLWRRSADGQLSPVTAGKVPTREGVLLAELKPTPKVIARLRDWFPRARLVGWKYEVDGGRPEALRVARAQIAECRTDACVANGPAYGPGFALVQPGQADQYLVDPATLYSALAELLVR